MLPRSGDDALMALVAAADSELSAMRTARAIIHVDARAAAGVRPAWSLIEGHPFDVLAGFTAPPHWRAVGVSTTGWAGRIDDGGCRRTGPGDRQRVRVTVLLDREGGAAGVMRMGAVGGDAGGSGGSGGAAGGASGDAGDGTSGDAGGASGDAGDGAGGDAGEIVGEVAGEVVPLPGSPEGEVADACRRALGLPTAPPPGSTLQLWTLAWLDRVVDVAGRAAAPDRLRTWAQVADLHAAAGPRCDPAALAAAAASLAEAWPWSRLRAEPSVVDAPGPVPAAELAAWMDDGMWARWLLARLPGEHDLLAAVRALLPARLVAGVEAVVVAARAAG
jgi:hypothetical protein